MQKTITTSDISKHVTFYLESLKEAENEIKSEKERGKALKDVIGKAYETHRKRIWEHFGCIVSKDKHDALFDVDWSITFNGKLIALEEDKGHYLDSCFLERALTGFAKTVHSYQKAKKSIPVLIIHSFTRYKKFNEKKSEDFETRKECIANELEKKLVYTTLTDSDRIKSDKWFGKCENCYSNNMKKELIIQDIKFILSLIQSPINSIAC